MQELYGDIFSSSESPRTLMFKRGYKNATTLESILKLMRGTNMTLVNAARNKTSSCQEDPNCIYGEEGYLSVLGVRGDIVTKNKKAYGVIDTKIVFGKVLSQYYFLFHYKNMMCNRLYRLPTYHDNDTRYHVGNFINALKTLFWSPRRCAGLYHTHAT